MNKLWRAITKIIEDKSKEMTEEEIRGNLFAFGDLRETIYKEIVNFNRPDYDLRKEKMNLSFMISVKHVLDIDNFVDLIQHVTYIAERLK